MQLLVSMEMFQGFDCEIDLLLMCLKEYHALSAVEFVGGAIMKAKLKVNSLLNVTKDKSKTFSLEKILGKAKVQ